LSGLNALSTAEALFILTTAQMLRPGTPVILENGGSIMNMKVGNWVQYSLERALFNWSVGEMGRYYGLPTWGVGGGTQVTGFDIQNGIESMLMVFAGMMSPVNMVCGIGSCSGGLGVSPEQILVDHDILEVCIRLKEGIKVDDEHLGFDSIRRVGPGGNFLDDELTLRLLKSGEHFYGGGFNLSGGHRPEDSMHARSHQRVQEILSSHRPRVPDNVVEEIGRFVREKENELSV
jgi:trimethylamine--corrinoid protein Co-methyltransferase